MNIFVICPHCECMIEILQINCGIFRHGVFKNSLQQINPHTPEITCKLYYDNGLIYGCGKPFRIVNNNGNYEAHICDYI